MIRHPLAEKMKSLLTQSPLSCKAYSADKSLFGRKNVPQQSAMCEVFKSETKTDRSVDLVSPHSFLSKMVFVDALQYVEKHDKRVVSILNRRMILAEEEVGKRQAILQDIVGWW